MDERAWDRIASGNVTALRRSRMPAYLDRGSQRDTMLLLAPMRTAAGETTTLRVRNVSAGGLMAEVDIHVAEDAQVHVDLRAAGTVSGRVAWVENGRLGLAFASPIDPRAVRRRPQRPDDETKLVITVARKSSRPALKVK